VPHYIKHIHISQHPGENLTYAIWAEGIVILKGLPVHCTKENPWDKTLSEARTIGPSLIVSVWGRSENLTNKVYPITNNR